MVHDESEDYNPYYLGDDDRQPNSDKENRAMCKAYLYGSFAVLAVIFIATLYLKFLK